MNNALRYCISGGLLAAAGLAGTAGAAAPNLKQQCAAAYEQTQLLRTQAHLKAAREQALFCSQDACPPASKKDCSTWLAEIERSLPTVVLAVRDSAGKETAAVQVSMDGAALVERLDGKAVSVDPGEHTFQFTIEGDRPREVKAVISEGEKNRRIETSFEPPPPPITTTTTTTTALSSAPAPAPPAPQTSTPAGVFVLGGLGIAGLGVFAGLGAAGAGEYGGLEKSCAPHCTASQLAGVRTKFLVADIGLATGIVSLGVATVLFIALRGGKAPPAKAAAAARALAGAGGGALPGGGFVTMSGRF